MGDYYNIIDTAVEEATKRAIEEGLAKGMAEGLEKGMAEGLEKGMAEGRAEGVENERLAIAYRMKNLGIDVDLISQVTGLSADEVAALVEEG